MDHTTQSPAVFPYFVIDTLHGIVISTPTWRFLRIATNVLFNREISVAKAKGGVSKADMIREAMRELGDAAPKDMQRYIADKYKTTISTTMISSYKSNFNRKQGGGGRRGSAEGAIGVKDLTVLRELIDRVGAPQLQSVIKVLTK
jgi:hypothetical protein